ARRGFDGRDDLARDAQLGEVPEARLAVGAVVPDRLVEAYKPFLDQVVGVTPDQEIRRGLQPDEAVIAADHPVGRRGHALLRERDQVLVVWLARVSLRGADGDGSPRRARDSAVEATRSGLPGAGCRRSGLPAGGR